MNDLKEELAINGRIIRELEKQIKSSTKDTTLLESKRLEYLKKHKEIIKKMKLEDSISIPEKVGLKIKEIATTIKIFASKNDILGKMKNTAFGTVFSSAVVTGISVAVSLLSGTLGVATIASLVPTISYIALANLIRNTFSDTEKAKVLKISYDKEKLKKEIADYIDNNINNNKEFRELLENRNKETDRFKKIELNKKVIKEIKEIRDKCDNQELKHLLSLQLIDNLNSLREIYISVREDYIVDKIKLSKLEFAKYEKELLELDIDIFKEENFLNEVGKETFKNIKFSAATMYAARILLSTIFPELQFASIKDVISPLILTLINNTASIGDIIEKLRMKSSIYNNMKVKTDNNEKELVYA